MKYLKTYEGWLTRWLSGVKSYSKEIQKRNDERDIEVDKIKQWMDQNKLESVDLESVGIDVSTKYKSGSEIIYKKIFMDANDLRFLVTDDKRFKINSLDTFYYMGEGATDPKTLREILDELKILTPEQIDQLRVEQESDKFNM